MQEGTNNEPLSPLLPISEIGTPWSKNPLSKVNPGDWK